MTLLSNLVTIDGSVRSTKYATDRFIMDCHSSFEHSLVSSQLQLCKLTSTVTIKSQFAAKTTYTTDSTPIKQIYCSRLSERKLIGCSTPYRKILPSAPERILDAPGLFDDFYLNVLDWNAHNIIAVALGASVYLWNGNDGSVRELFTLLEEGRYCSSLAWIHDGKSIAVGCSNGMVQIWDVEKSRKLRTMIVSPHARISALSWNRHLLTTGSRNGSILTHDVRMAKHLSTEHQNRGSFEVCGLAWSPDGQQLASGANDNLVHIWDTTNPNLAVPRLVLEGHRSAVKALAWCPWKGHVLASGGGSADKSIRLWNTTSGNCLDNLETGSQISALLWSRHGRELLSAHGYERNHLALWSVDEMARDLRLVADIDHAHDSRILHMKLSFDGRMVATAAADESIKFWPIFSSVASKSKKDLRKPFGNCAPNESVISPFSLRTRIFR